MKASWIVVLLATMVALLGGIAAGIGFFCNRAAVPQSFKTIRGDTVTLYGTGLYRFDSLFFGAGYKGQNKCAHFSIHHPPLPIYMLDFSSPNG